MRGAAGLAVAAILAGAGFGRIALAQSFTDDFADRADGAKVHSASGFVCPLKIGGFERDAVGQYQPEQNSVFCAYSARDGVYGTVVLKPLSGPYDPRASLDREFALQAGTGGRQIGEATLKLAGRPDPVVVYSRSYETARLLDAHYRALYTGAGFANWAVETTIEYAEPRDSDSKQEFLAAVYSAARAGFPAAVAPLAAGTAPR
jgi:hypothetical protein